MVDAINCHFNLMGKYECNVVKKYVAFESITSESKQGKSLVCSKNDQDRDGTSSKVRFLAQSFFLEEFFFLEKIFRRFFRGVGQMSLHFERCQHARGNLSLNKFYDC